MSASTMRAATYSRYADLKTLQIRSVPIPTPQENEVLVKIKASSINKVDYILFTGKPFVVRFINGLLRPKRTILGDDLSGIIEKVGPGVTGFQPGDPVFGVKFGSDGPGTYAEYAAVKANQLALKPSNLSFEEAASMPIAALTALIGLRNGRIREGAKVLINGASGGVGNFAIQIAKSFGAEVTAVCSSRHLATARSSGADRVIDYTKEDFTAREDRYDLILGANGYVPITRYKRALAPSGAYVMAGGKGAQIFQAILVGKLVFASGGKTVSTVSAVASRKDLELLIGLAGHGKIKPVIDTTYPLEDIAEAFRAFKVGHTRGKIVITI